MELIRLRCLECGECQLWQGSTNAKGHPKYRQRSARRVVWEAEKGPLKDSQLLTVTCGQAMCLNVAHMKLTNKSEVARISNARPAVKAKKSASSSRTNQAKFGKLTMEKARYIRASDKRGIDLALELGVSRDLVCKVRQYRAWKEPHNPFAGLMG